MITKFRESASSYIEDWIDDEFLWKEVTVKEAFKENYTKYHYKNHLFEQGVLK